jgi:hypothetical protein
MSTTPTIVDSIDSLIDSRLRGLHVAIPGRVESYDESTQSADVQPLIQRGYEDESGNRAIEDLPVVPGVPVVFPGAGSFSITFPVVKGDTVLLIFSQASIDKWLGQGGKVDPLEDHHHDLSDGIAIPGLRSFNAATGQVHSSAMVLGASKIKLGSKDAADPVVRESDLAALKTWLDTHVHTGVTTGAGSSTAPASPSPTVTGSPDLEAD